MQFLQDCMMMASKIYQILDISRSQLQPETQHLNPDNHKSLSCSFFLLPLFVLCDTHEMNCIFRMRAVQDRLWTLTEPVCCQNRTVQRSNKKTLTVICCIRQMLQALTVGDKQKLKQGNNLIQKKQKKNYSENGKCLKYMLTC